LPRKGSLHKKREERFMNRSIVITGASKGIGRAAAEALAAAGCQGIGIARHTPTNFPGQFVTADLSDPEQVRRNWSSRSRLELARQFNDVAHVIRVQTIDMRRTYFEWSAM
jgi:NAD(P)-dependent dehydrogenase (short-subunit alcohol dehydrogenase family)